MDERSLGEGSVMTDGMGSLGSFTRVPGGFTLEEDAAHRDAVAMASKPDLAPLAALLPLVGVGMLQPGAGYESTLYLPVERQEQAAAPNLAVSFQRLDVAAPDAEKVPIITDVTFVESVGDEKPVTVHLGADYSLLLQHDLVPHGGGEEGGEDEDESKWKHCYLAVRAEPAGACTRPPLVDLALVYGGGGGGGAAPPFDMGGGFDTVALPTSVRDAFGGAALYLCLKREGAGSAFAEQLASRAAAEAADAMHLDAESAAGGGGGTAGAGGGGHGLAQHSGGHGSSTVASGHGNSTVGQMEHDLDDELLDTSLTPEQIRSLEATRAAELRARTQRAEAAEAEAAREARALRLRREVGASHAQRSAVLAKNAELAHRVASAVARTAAASEARRGGRKRAAAEGGASSVGGGGGGGGPGGADSGAKEKEYGEVLNRIVEVEEKHTAMASEYERVSRDLQRRLDHKEAKAADIYDTFAAFKGQIAKQAAHTRTGKALPPHEVDEFFRVERERDDELSRVRLRNINLRLLAGKVEAALRSKEQLAEGLHLVDFEQLKIENQTLSEKIEERTTELFKLKKKKTECVVVLSHIKEKLHFMAGATAAAGGAVKALDAQVGALRNKLNAAKRERERLKKEKGSSGSEQGFATSDRLVADFEQRKQAILLVKEKIAEAKDKYHNLAAFVEGAAED